MNNIYDFDNSLINWSKYQLIIDELVLDGVNVELISIRMRELAIRAVIRVTPLIANDQILKVWMRIGRVKCIEGVDVLLDAVARSQMKNFNDRISRLNIARAAANHLASAAIAVLKAGDIDSVAAAATFSAAAAAAEVNNNYEVSWIVKLSAQAAQFDLNTFVESLDADFSQIQNNKVSLFELPLWVKAPEWFSSKVGRLEVFISRLAESGDYSAEALIRIYSALEYLKSEAIVMSVRFQLSVFAATNQFNFEIPAVVDKLNRQKLVNALAANLTHSSNRHHRAIGLLGEWGSGKSTVLKLLKDELKKTHKEQPFVFGEFNAWAYEHTDNIQAGVAQEMINALTSAPESLESKVKDKSEPEKEKTNVNLGVVWNKLCSLIYKLPDLLSNYLLMDIRDVRTGFVSFVTRGKLWVAVTWLVQRAWLTLQFSVKTHPFEILKILVLLLVAAMPWFTDWFDGLINDKDLAIVGQWVWSGGLVLYTLREFGKLIISPQAKELLTYLRLPSYAEHLGKIPVMRKHISTLCELRLKEKNGKTPRLLFVVDDLDRCSPEAIVKVLEAVRLVLDLENVIVLIAIDQHIALAALSKHFNDFAIHHKLKNSHAIAREYLSKVINLPILLTAPSGNDVRELMVDLWRDIHKDSTVDASDAGREDSIDNTPTQVTSETNLPAADSKALSDKLPVADGSPNPGFKVDVKPKIPEGDQQPSGEIHPIKALSPAQQQSFIHWVNYFELTNPRQIKRLNNSYDLMRSYLPQWDKEKEVIEFALTEGDVLKVYPMLLTLILMEYLNSLHSLTERSQLWEKLFSEPVIAGFESAKVGIPRVKVTEINNKRVTSDFVKAYRSLLAAEGNKSLVSNVEAFVLPAMN